MADAVGLPALLAGADVVLTGEGSFDSQSLHGKVVDGVRDCAPDDAAIVVVAGRVELSASQVAVAGLAAAVSIARGPGTEDELRSDAAELITEAAETACCLLHHRAPRPASNPTVRGSTT